MKKLVVATVLCLLLIVGGIVATVVGILHTTQFEVTHVDSDYFSEGVHVAVYMPPTYEMYVWSSYPVLYVHGGYGLMEHWQGDDTEEWTMKDTLDELMLDEDMQEMVVVAVADKEGQIEELTSDLDAETLLEGEGEYSQFFREEIQPYAEEHYRLSTEAEHVLLQEGIVDETGNMHKQFRDIVIQMYE